MYVPAWSADSFSRAREVDLLAARAGICSMCTLVRFRPATA